MILDEQALFSDAQKVTTTAVSTNMIQTNGDIGKGEPVELLVQVVEDFAGATSVAVAIQTCDKKDGTFEDIVTTNAVALADLKAGFKFPIKCLPTGIKNYLQLKYVVAGTATAGAITAGIVSGSSEGYHVG